VGFDFDEPVERAGTWSNRWDRYAGRDVIPLWVADADFRAAPPVLEAMGARIEHGVLGYTAPPPVLREAIVERLLRLYGWRVNPDWIVFLSGVVPGLHHAVRSLTQPQDAVIVPTPVYQHLAQAVDAAGRRRLAAPLVLQGGRWVLDLDALRQHIASRPRMLMLCNPQNPGGTVFTAKELAEIAEISRDAIVISDEIHCDLVLEAGRKHVPIAALGEEVGRRCVTLLSPNKAFNFPGAGCAWAVIEDPALRASFAADIERHIVPLPSVFGYVGALAALRDGAPWLAALVDYLRGNRELVEREIGTMPGLAMAHVEATYLAWIDCSQCGIADAHRHFLQHGVALSPGAQFGDPRFVRLNFGTQRARLAEALARMKRAVTAVRS
jgi:cysteine-S-conjugate beta-lyase